MDQTLPRLKASLGIRSPDGTLPRRPLTSPNTRRPMYAQSKCNLFTLPYEIRLLIYKEVIASWLWGSKIHIRHITQSYREKINPGYLSVTPCRAKEQTDEWWELLGQEDLDAGRRRRTRLGVETSAAWPDTCGECSEEIGWGPFGVGHLQRGQDKLGMFLVCRKIYTETIDLLYTTFTFQVDHALAVHEFFTTVPMVHLNRIKRLQIMWMWSLPKYILNSPSQTALGWTVRKLQDQEKKWLRCSKIISHMTGLEALRVRLLKPIDNYNLYETRILAPLRGLKVLNNNCVLELPAVAGWKQGDGLVGTNSWDNGFQYRVERREQPRASTRTISQAFHQMPLWAKVPLHLVAIALVPPVVVLNVGTRSIIKGHRKLDQRKKKKTRMSVAKSDASKVSIQDKYRDTEERVNNVSIAKVQGPVHD